MGRSRSPHDGSGVGAERTLVGPIRAFVPGLGDVAAGSDLVGFRVAAGRPLSKFERGAEARARLERRPQERPEVATRRNERSDRPPHPPRRLHADRRR
jgi:hypothetical protein